jgi:ABC-type dipeptide/oligopeptide/nickel transport system permease component
VQMGLLVLTVGVMLSNFAADVIYTYLDPRIRYD